MPVRGRHGIILYELLLGDIAQSRINGLTVNINANVSATA